MPQRIDLATIGAVIAGAAIGAAGHPLLQAVIYAAFADLATGLLKAWAKGTVESQRLGRGVYKILALLGVGAALVLIGRVSAESLIAANALGAIFLLREALSIVENLHETGVAIGVEIPAISLLARVLHLQVAKAESKIEKETTHV